MMKWLRLYSKQIMVVVVLLAMFSFVGGSALVSFLQPNAEKEVYARAFGHDLNGKARNEAQTATNVLERLFVDWRYGQAGATGEKFTLDHWLLLAEEAQRAGIVVADKEVDDALDRLVQQASMYGAGVDLVDTLRVRDRITLPMIRASLRKHIAVLKNAEHISGAAVPSEPQMRHYVHETEDKIKVKVATLDAQQWVDKTEAISPADLKAQFDQYKDVVATESDTGMGYKYYNREKVQYVVAPVKEIEAKVVVSLDDAKIHWRANKAKYTKKEWVDLPPASAPAGSQPTSKPVAPTRKEVTREKSFAEAREAVEKDIRSKKATQSAQQAMRRLAEIMGKPWADEKTDATTGYKAIPAEAKNPNALRDAAAKVSKEFGIELRYGETPLWNKTEIGQHPDLADVSLEQGGQPILTIQDYAFHVPPFYKVDPATDSSVRLQLFQTPDAPLRSFGGNTRLVLFRVVEAHEHESPASVDEVKDKVESDVRLLRAYARAEPIARKLYAVARKVGLDEAMKMVGDKRINTGSKAPIALPAFARKSRLRGMQAQKAMEAGKSTLGTPVIPGLGEAPAFVDACFEMTAKDYKSPEAAIPDEPALKPATTRPAMTPAPVEKLVALPKQHKWCVVELIAPENVDSNRYQNDLRESAYYTLMSERGQALRSSWFKPETIEKRTGFKRIEMTGPRRPLDENMSAPPQQEAPIF